MSLFYGIGNIVSAGAGATIASPCAELERLRADGIVPGSPALQFLPGMAETLANLQAQCDQSRATTTSTAPTLNLRKRSSLSSSSAGPSTRSACEIYEAAVKAGQNAAILAALKPKCTAEKLAGGYAQGGASVGGGGSSSMVIASSGATLPAPVDGKASPPASGDILGLSPVVAGAVAVAAAVVGFVAYSRLKK